MASEGQKNAPTTRLYIGTPGLDETGLVLIFCTKTICRMRFFGVVSLFVFLFGLVMS